MINQKTFAFLFNVYLIKINSLLCYVLKTNNVIIFLPSQQHFLQIGITAVDD